MKRTPFFHDEVAAGAKMLNQQGWEMPIDFGDPKAEHLAVRNGVGTFDWASTGEIEICGPDALALVQKVIVNDASTMPVGRVLYSTMCHADGAIFSDITVYRMDEMRYWVMTAWGSNRDNQRPEYDTLIEQSAGLNVTVTDLSPGVAILAVQGPRSRDVVAKLADPGIDNLPYMDWMVASVGGIPRAMISRTGYTGELGYELIVPSEHGHELWEAVMAAGQEYQIRPAGTTAAFSLRMEKGYIARFDILDHVTPYEARLGWTVKLDKGDFTGREALLKQHEQGVSRQLVTIAMQDDLVPAGGCAILREGHVVGRVTSSAFGHTMHCPLSLAVISLDSARPGTEISVESEGGLHPARVVPKPYYDPKGLRLRS